MNSFFRTPPLPTQSSNLGLSRVMYPNEMRVTRDRGTLLRALLFQYTPRLWKNSCLESARDLTSIAGNRLLNFNQCSIQCISLAIILNPCFRIHR